MRRIMQWAGPLWIGPVAIALSGALCLASTSEATNADAAAIEMLQSWGR